jgi:recombination protein RecA
VADAFTGLVRAAHLEEALPQGWSLEVVSGRLVELSGCGSLTIACALVREAQQRGEPVAWISAAQTLFYPPDLAAGGIDLDALPVIRAGDGRRSARVADRLLRSGAFGLVVVDLEEHRIGPTAQGRLAQVARHNDTALLCLTGRRRGDGSSMVSLRGQVRRSRVAPALFGFEMRVTKDKRRGPGWVHREVFRAPDGLR